MDIFVHGGKDHPLRRIEVDETSNVAVVLEEHLPDGGAFWRENEDEPVSPEAVLVEIGVAEGERVYLGACKKVASTVNFGGNSKVHEQPPGATCGSLFDWAVGPKGFNLPEAEKIKHALALCDTEELVDRSAHVGEFADDECKACFDLVPVEKHEG